MKKYDKIWLAAWVIFWLSLTITFLADTLGIFETNNLGFIETIWISWMMFTVGLGIVLAIITRVTVKQ